MKLKEIKHNHTLTDILKVFIFALIMLAPIAMIGTKCLYVICNKNAYQSYSQTKTLTNIEQFEYMQYYQYDSNNNLYGFENSYTLYINDININQNSSYTQLHYDNGTIYYDYDDDSYTITFGNETENEPNVIFTFKYNTKIGIVEDYTQYKKINTNYLDNVFEYSVSQLEQSPLFNWTQNTAIYTGVETMNSQLGINNQAINILLVYWFLMIVIYIIIDIILKVYTILTHMITRRV